MKNNIKSILAIAVIALIVAAIPVFVSAQATVSNGDDDATAITSNGQDDSTTVTSNGGDDISNSHTSNGRDDSTTVVSNGSDDSVPASSPANGGNPSVGGGPVSNGSRSSGGGYIGGGSSLPLLSNIGQCEYIQSYLKSGNTNSIMEVNKLQAFLKNTENIDVDITGSFDQKTFDAVETFQTRYSVDILVPWGIHTPTGNVYYTTRKKINEIYCKTSFALTPSQIAEIERYRTSIQNGLTPSSNEVGIKIKTNNDSTVLVSNGESTTTETQTAAASNVSFVKKLWSFVKKVFGR